MKPENIILLGFVNQAVDYLEKHMDDEPDNAVARLRNIDLNSLKDALDKNLDASLGMMTATMNSLLKAGSDSFDSFVESHGDRGALSAEINHLFDLDQEGNVSEDDIANLMAYYDLEEPEKDQTFVTEKTQEETVAEMPEEPVILPETEAVTETEPDVSDDTEAETEAVAETETDVSDDGEQETVFEMSDEDVQLLKLISQNVDKVNQEQAPEETVPQETDSEEKKLDHIFSQVIGNQDKNYMNANPGTYVPSDVNVTESGDLMSLVKDMQDSDIKYYQDIPAVPMKDPTPQPDDHFSNNYFSEDIVAQLRKRMLQEDEEKKRREEDFKEISDKIQQVYPYLKIDFIKAVFDLKDSIVDEYPLGIAIIILHRIIFRDVEHMQQFIEIAINHGYSINADEKRLLVDVFKQHMNADGTIITSIFDVANQCALLDGRYEGYRVLFEERA